MTTTTILLLFFFLYIYTLDIQAIEFEQAKHTHSNSMAFWMGFVLGLLELGLGMHRNCMRMGLEPDRLVPVIRKEDLWFG